MYSRMTEIIKATIDDLPDLVTMGRAFFHEAQWHKLYEWSNESASIALTDLIKNPQAIVYLAKQESIAIGMAAAVLYPLWYNTDIKVAQEFFLYVKPEKRGIGTKLKNKLEEVAIEMGAITMAMGSVESLPSLDTYYARSGYFPSEKTFIKRLVWCHP